MLNYIPGFRSKNKIKMIIASIYYAMAIFISTTNEVGIAGLGVYIGIPLVILSLISYVKGAKTDKIYKRLSYTGAVLIIAGGAFTASQDKTTSSSQISAKSVSVSNIKTDPKSTNLIFNMVSQDQEDKAVSVLGECGIEKIKEVTYDSTLDGDGLKGYRLSTEYDNISDVVAYFDNEKIRQIRFLGQYLYKNQEVVSLATDHFLSDSQQSDYQIQCKKVVESVLKAPSTAKFPNILKWAIFKEEGSVIVQSYVDSQNSFGAMLRSEFQFKIKDDNIVSFILDGEEYIK